MDGTLLMSDKSVHPDSVRDIREVTARGVQVVYCSGRSVPEIMPYRSIFPMIDFAICMSGAVLYDLKAKRSLFCRPISEAAAARIAETAEKYGGMLHLLLEEESIVSASDITHMADFYMEAYQPTYQKVMKTVPSAVEEACRHEKKAKMNIYFRSPGDRQKAYEELRDLPLTFVFAEKTSLEMNAAGVTKAEGLRALCDYLGIAPGETIGIGDAENDRAFLEISGLSVAMGNSEPGIMSLCDAVTDDNNNNGVGKALIKYC